MCFLCRVYNLTLYNGPIIVYYIMVDSICVINSNFWYRMFPHYSIKIFHPFHVIFDSCLINIYDKEVNEFVTNDSVLSSAESALQ